MRIHRAENLRLTEYTRPRNHRKHSCSAEALRWTEIHAVVGAGDVAQVLSAPAEGDFFRADAIDLLDCEVDVVVWVEEMTVPGVFGAKIAAEHRLADIAVRER